MASPSRDDFKVGWICALKHELAVSVAMLDEEVPLPAVRDEHDDNIYTAGKLHGHYIIMACMPAGVYGKASAAVVATNMLRSFPAIRFGLMVGIGGAVPDKEDIRLGDVVVSKASGSHGGVIQYDMGKALPNGGFEVRGHLNKPPTLLSNALAALDAEHERHDSKMLQFMEKALNKSPKMRKPYGYPGSEHDHLYETECIHRKEIGCSRCNGPAEIPRRQRYTWDGNADPSPRIFYGLIGSGDEVVSSATKRKHLARAADILCFEMEAAGLKDNFPCLVIRGISDYADAYKRDEWQKYAALAAAAYAKELLEKISAAKIRATATALEVFNPSGSIVSNQWRSTSANHSQVFQGTFHGLNVSKS